MKKTFEWLFYLFGALFLLLSLMPAQWKPTLWPFNLVSFAGYASIVPGFCVVAFGFFIFKPIQPAVFLKENGSAYNWIKIGLGAMILLALGLYSVPHVLWGDGNLIKAFTGAHADYPFKLGDQNIKTLITVVSPLLGWSTESLFRIFSVSGGIAYIGGIFLLTRGIKNGFAGLFVYVLLLSYPSLLFFTNYKETYPLLMGLFVLYIGLSYELKNSIKENVALTLLLLVLMVLHPLFVVFVFSHCFRFMTLKFINVGLLKWFAAIAGLGSLAFILYSSFIDKNVFDSNLFYVFKHSQQVYPLFSLKHLLDFVLYLSMAVLPAGFLLLLINFRKDIADGRMVTLASYAISMLAFLPFLDLKLGAMDWDIFSLFSFPLLVFPIMAFANSARTDKARILVVVLGLSLIRLVPWLVINANVENAADYAMNIAKYDAHQQSGTRKYSLSMRLRDAGLNDLALLVSKDLFEREGNENPVARNNYALSLRDKGNYDEARKIWSEITRVAPGYYHANANLGELYVQVYNQPDSAYKYLSKAHSLRPDASDVLYALAFLDMRAMRFAEAREKFRKVTELNPLHGDAYAKVGMIAMQLGDKNEAVSFFDKAIETGGIPEPTRAFICNAYRQFGLKDKHEKCLKADKKPKQ